MTPFAEALTEAMTARGMTAVALAEDMGSNVSTISDWKRGRRLPGMENAHALAEALDWPALSRLAMKARTRTCPVCEAAFVIRSKATRHGAFCSKACRAAAAYRRLYGTAKEHDGRVARNRLTMYQDAVLAFCTSCTARTLLCTQPECELRSVSPARLDRRMAA